MNTDRSYFYTLTGIVELVMTVVLPLLVIGGTYSLPDSAGYFPEAMAAIILFSGIMSIVFPPAKIEASEMSFAKEILIVTAVLVGFWFAIPILGFYASSTILLLVFHIKFVRKDRSFSPVKCTIFLTVTVGSLYVLFFKILHVMTPNGLLF